MSVIFLETHIKASPEVCYKLSLNVDLHQVSTNKTGEHIIAGVRSGIMKMGDTVTWKARHFGIWQTLTTKITEEQPFLFFVDEMLDGAFKTMKHDHYFFKNENGTIMKDVFVFKSPLGFLGGFFNYLILDNYMTRFLEERNNTIKQIAESDNYKLFL